MTDQVIRTESATQIKSHAQREHELDIRSSGLDTKTDIGAREALQIILRTAAYIRYFPFRYTAKFVLKLASYAMPLAILPWPAKMIVDQVIQGQAITPEVIAAYPGYFQPFVEALATADIATIIVWLAVFGLTLVLLIGSYTTGYEDEVDAGLAQGQDYATQVENKLHGGHSTASGIFGYLEFRLNTRLTQILNHTLRAHIFSRIAGLSITKLDDQRIGDSIYRVMYDAPQVNEIFYEITHTPFMSIILYLQSIAIMLAVYPDRTDLIVLSVLIFPAWLILSSFFSRVVRKRGQAARAAGAITTATAEEGFDNILAVQSLGANTSEKDRFDSDSDESFYRFRRVAVLWIVIIGLSGYLGMVFDAVYFYILASNVIEGNLTVGDAVALGVYFGYLRGPAFALSWLWIRFMDNVAAMRRVFAFLDIPPEQDFGEHVIDDVVEGVQLSEVGFTYPDGRVALRDIDLDAKVGEIIALCGTTGSGKTTLAYLIPRYHVATTGSVLVDSQDVNDITVDSLRDQVTYVFQETQLFSDTIYNNIKYGKADATFEEVEQVARTAGIHEFITSLPDGYETKLGTATSSKISVGQKQRISIARGLLRPSKILILDEPTSALDPETEGYLVQSLQEAAKNRLVIVIAHRLSTIANADRIYFLEEGRILESGAHEELMARADGRYRSFVDLQLSSATT